MDERLEEASAAWKYTEPCREEPHEEGRLFPTRSGTYRASTDQNFRILEDQTFRRVGGMRNTRPTFAWSAVIIFREPVGELIVLWALVQPRCGPSTSIFWSPNGPRNATLLNGSGRTQLHVGSHQLLNTQIFREYDVTLRYYLVLLTKVFGECWIIGDKADKTRRSRQILWRFPAVPYILALPSIPLVHVQRETR